MALLNHITVFGDSVAKGVCLKDGKVQKLDVNAVELVADSFDTKIENNSVFGQTLKRLYDRGTIQTFAKKLDYDNNIVVLALGGNDSDYDWEVVQKDPNFPQGPKTSLKDFSFMLSDCIKMLKASRATVVVCSLCPVDSKRYFENVLSKKFDGEKIKQFLHGDLENIYRHQEMFNLEAFKVATKLGCKFLDYRFAFLERQDFREFLCDDGIHPNEKGQKLIAEVAIKEIEETHNPFLFNFLLAKNPFTNVRISSNMKVSKIWNFKNYKQFN